MIKDEIFNKALRLHRERSGKIITQSTFKIKNKKEYRYAMSPGVAGVARKIYKTGVRGAYDYTIKSKTVGFITDGSSVLGLGNLGPYSGITIVEGKAALLSEFTGINGIPISLDTQNTKEIIKTIRNIAPVFGAINLEDISAPRCFEIEDTLKDLGIPVFHDDQHGASIVVYAALINAAKVANKEFTDLNVVISGAGAAGSAIARMLLGIDNNGKSLNLKYPRVKDITLLDSKGIIHKKRNDLDKYTKNLAQKTNRKNMAGSLIDAIPNTDVFIGVSVGKIFHKKLIKLMNDKPIIFAMANPIPEISQHDALSNGAFIYGSGRGDSKIHINNMIAFPGVFKGLLALRAKVMLPYMRYQVAFAISKMIKPSKERLLPDPFKKDVASEIAKIMKSRNRLEIL